MKIHDACESRANTPLFLRITSAKSDALMLQGLKEELTQAQLRFIVSHSGPLTS